MVYDVQDVEKKWNIEKSFRLPIFLRKESNTKCCLKNAILGRSVGKLLQPMKVDDRNSWRKRVEVSLTNMHKCQNGSTTFLRKIFAAKNPAK